MPSNTTHHAHAHTRRQPVNLHLDLPPHSPPQHIPPQTQVVQPPVRPPSRSEFLLRETLLKDGEEREKERRRRPSTGHQRRPSLGANERLPDIGHERRPSCDVASNAMPKQRRASLNRSVTDGDLDLRPVARSPPPLPSTSPLTPHEHILRARLERVLSASSMHSQSSQPNPYEERMVYSPKPRREETPLYLPTPVSAGGASPIQKTGDFFTSQNSRSTSRARSRTEPAPTPLSLPSTSSSRSQSLLFSGPSKTATMPSSRPPPSPATPRKKFAMGLETVPSVSDLRGRGKGRRHEDGMEMITPPPTPPPAAFHLNLAITPIKPPHQRHHTRSNTFDAHTASAQCRQQPGYVSFASVDGLGEPESSEVESEVEADRTREKGKGKWLGIF
ncbi:hypothetical protein VNI00_008430 [Paramarasmius palmivorus]|uniref:Uncharacterized protein n=1 Tax=Paramarasmius palmivorus TaxID=297713 RepID=A0AAW0CW52_9AGAR